MPRGLAPRRPARTGRQDKVRRVATNATSRGKVSAPKAPPVSKGKPAAAPATKMQRLQSDGARACGRDSRSGLTNCIRL